MLSDYGGTYHAPTQPNHRKTKPMSKPTKHYRVEVAVSVEAYSSIVIEARSAVEAERKAKGIINRDGYVDAVFSPDWDTQEKLRVVEGLTDEADPSVTIIK